MSKNEKNPPVNESITLTRAEWEKRYGPLKLTNIKRPGEGKS